MMLQLNLHPEHRMETPSTHVQAKSRVQKFSMTTNLSNHSERKTHMRTPSMRTQSMRTQSMRTTRTWSKMNRSHLMKWKVCLLRYHVPSAWIWPIFSHIYADVLNQSSQALPNPHFCFISSAWPTQMERVKSSIKVPLHNKAWLRKYKFYLQCQDFNQMIRKKVTCSFIILFLSSLHIGFCSLDRRGWFSFFWCRFDLTLLIALNIFRLNVYLVALFLKWQVSTQSR